MEVTAIKMGLAHHSSSCISVILVLEKSDKN